MRWKRTWWRVALRGGYWGMRPWVQLRDKHRTARRLHVRQGPMRLGTARTLTA